MHLFYRSNSSCWFEPEIIKIGQSSHKIYINNILNFQESTTIVNAFTKTYGNLLKALRMYKEDFALNNLQATICRKTQPNRIFSIFQLLYKWTV